MAPLPPLMRDQRKVDAEHLKLLAIFHFVGAGFGALGLVFVALHYSLFSFFFTNPKIIAASKGNPPPAEFFAILKWFYVLGAIWFLGYLVLNLLSAFCLRARKRRVFSLVVGGLNCVHIPFGTVLGVFTIIVLVRDSVQELYETEKVP